MPGEVKGSSIIESVLEPNLRRKLESNYKKEVERNDISKRAEQKVPVTVTHIETLI